MRVGALIVALQASMHRGEVTKDSRVTFVTMEAVHGMKVVSHAFVEHVEVMSCIAGTDDDGVELSGRQWDVKK